MPQNKPGFNPINLNIAGILLFITGLIILVIKFIATITDYLGGLRNEITFIAIAAMLIGLYLIFLHRKGYSN